jgi:hypothetical protein
MKPTRNMKIANLEVRISLLQQQERRLRSIISSTLTAPELRERTKVELSSTLKRLTEEADELMRIQQEKP